MPGQHQGAVSDNAPVLLTGIELLSLLLETYSLAETIVTCHHS
jgi:hypothetical protein